MTIDACRNPDLVRILARRALGGSHSAECIDWAVARLVEGREETTIGILAGLSPAEEDEVYRYLLRAMGELGLKPLSEKNCLLEYAALLAEDMLANRALNRSSFTSIMKILFHLRYPAELYHWHKLECYFDEVEYMGTPVRAEIDELCKETATRFLDVIKSWRRTGIFRLDPVESMRRLEEVGLAEKSENPDAVAGIFRRSLESIKIEDLSLANIDICRSTMVNVSFDNSDLTLAKLCWNDFQNCNFSGSVLFQADLRRSVFVGCQFNDANLAGADLRGATFEKCSFYHGKFLGALIDRTAGLFSRFKIRKLRLTATQAAQLRWTRSAGPEPPGG